MTTHVDNPKNLQCPSKQSRARADQRGAPTRCIALPCACGYLRLPEAACCGSAHVSFLQGEAALFVFYFWGRSSQRCALYVLAAGWRRVLCLRARPGSPQATLPPLLAPEARQSPVGAMCCLMLTCIGSLAFIPEFYRGIVACVSGTEARCDIKTKHKPYNLPQRLALRRRWFSRH